MNTRIKNNLWLVASLALIVLLSACNAANSVPPTQAAPLRVTYSLWPGDYPAILAQELGLFEKHGVQVTLIPLENYSDLMSLFLSGQADISLPTWVEAITMNDRKPGYFKVILAYDYSDGADHVVCVPEIQTIADLRGKRIGVTPRTFGEMFVREMLAREGLTINDVTLVDLGPEQIVSNLPDKIDAGYTWEPYTSQALKQGYNVLFDSRSTPGLLADTIIARTDIVRNRPQNLQAFVDAWFEALAYWQANPAQAAAIIAQTTDQQPEDISLEGIHMYSREENRQIFDPNGGPLSLFTTGQTITTFLKSVGLLSAPPDINALLDPSFIQ